MSRKGFLLIFTGLIVSVQLFGQKIDIDVENMPVNKVLIEIRTAYDISFSFDDLGLSKYKVTIDGSFACVEDVLREILSGIPFQFVKSDNVFIIFPDNEDEREAAIETPVFHLSGQIVERKSKESLPFTNILINGNGMSADEQGRFMYKSALDSLFEITISHLGYYIMDTVLVAGTNHMISLTPSMEKLEEIIITDRLLENFVYKNYEPGVFKLNHNITRFLPGSSDNSVFNLLRLQSGILAAAEQSTELMIWGSYEGQSRIVFDDFVLFGLRNFNDNISAVNPFIVKNIKVMKAGFDAEFGNCVGGIAQITGKDGYSNKTKLNVSLNNYTVNGLIEIPVSKNSNLLIGYRQTYYNLYDNKDVYMYRQTSTLQEYTLTTQPDYDFRDVNVKYNYQNNQGFYLTISFLYGKDNFSYTIDEDILNRALIKETSEENIQKGASFKFGKSFNSGYNTDVKLSYSQLKTQYDDFTSVSFINSGNLISQNTLIVDNTTSEIMFSWQNDFQINEHHQFSANLDFTNMNSSWNEDSADVNMVNQVIRGNQYSLVVMDQMVFSSTHVNTGLRLNYIPVLDAVNIEPRISLSQQLGEYFNAKLAFGIYKQYAMKSSIVDEYNNYRYMWVVADDETYPVLTAYHWVGGLTMDFDRTKLSIEPYYKNVDGLTRYINHAYLGYELIYQGKGRSYGLDVYLKHDVGDHTGWISYTLSKTEEYFDYLRNDEYIYAPQDQRHEVKLALLLNFEPIYLSANYVYGSGFPIVESINPITYSRTPYNRLDAALVYKFTGKRIFGEAGLSVLNIFDTENILYSNLERVPTSQTASIEIYSQSVPFTPTLYLKIGF